MMEIKINLLSSKKNNKKKEIKIFIIFLGMILLTIFCINNYILNLINIQNKKNQQLRKEIVLYDLDLAKIKKIKKHKYSLLQKIIFLQDLENDRFLNLHLLIELVKLIPNEVYLNSLKNESKKISVEGRAMTHQSISTFMQGIEQNPWMDQVHLLEENKTKFRLSFEILFNSLWTN